MRKRKVSIIGGAGNVGSACGLFIAQQGYADIVLVDMAGERAQGRALDILQASPLWATGYTSISIVGTDDYAAIENSDVVIVAAGRARRPDETREDLVRLGMSIMVGDKENPGVIPQIARYAPGSIIVMVTNPVDVMTYVAYRVSDFPIDRVVGQGGMLDSLRFRTLIAEELGVPRHNVVGDVIGSHGDMMVPLARLAAAYFHDRNEEFTLRFLLSEEQIEEIVRRTREGGRQIVELAGGAHIAPAAATEAMVRSIVLNHKQIFPCSVYLQGEYGIYDICLGVHVRLGAGGVRDIIELELNEEELTALRRSAESVREVIALTGL